MYRKRVTFFEIQLSKIVSVLPKNYVQDFFFLNKYKTTQTVEMGKSAYTFIT